MNGTNKWKDTLVWRLVSQDMYIFSALSEWKPLKSVWKEAPSQALSAGVCFDLVAFTARKHSPAFGFCPNPFYMATVHDIFYLHLSIHCANVPNSLELFSQCGGGVPNFEMLPPETLQVFAPTQFRTYFPWSHRDFSASACRCAL